MKKIFLSLAILASLTLATNMNAQDGKRGGKKDYTKELNLSADQQKKIESVNKDFEAKRKELKSNSDLSKEDKQSQMKALKEQHRSAVNKELTADQQAKFKEFKDKKKDGKRSDRKGKQKDAKNDKKRSGSKMKSSKGDRSESLNLTDDQKQKIKTAREDFKGKSEKLSQEHREALNKIYTPEQQAKIKERKDKSFAKNNRSDFRKGRGYMGKLDDASVAKLRGLKENFVKEKKAIELSRLAPDAQKQKISELKDSFKKEKRQIIDNARKSKSEDKKPV